MPGLRPLAAFCALVWPLAGLADVPPALSPGWLELAVPEGLTSSNDEIIGALIEGGVAAQDVLWLKPTYGDQNFALMPVPPQMAAERLARMQSSGTPVPGPEGCTWQGAGVLTNPSFGMMVFTATQADGPSRLALFWGSHSPGVLVDFNKFLASDTGACPE